MTDATFAPVGSRSPPPIMEDSSTVPLWKQEFMAKKKALRDYQRKSSEKLLSNQEPENRNSANARDGYDQRIDNNARAEPNDNIILIEHKHNNGYQGQKRGSASQNNGNGDSVTPSYNHTEEMVVGDSEHCEAQDNVENDNSDEDSDCSSGDGDGGQISNGRLGGYSFITGEVIVAESDTTESSSEVTDESAGSETGTPELKYKPGFVSQLLNKFSNMSYQGQTLANGTSVASKPPSLPIAPMPFKATRPVYSSVSIAKKDSSRQIEGKPTQQLNDNVIDLTSPRAPVNVEPQSSGKSKASVSEDVRRNLKTNPYRAPSEIILIEGPSSKTVSPQSSTEGSRLPSPRSTQTTEEPVVISPTEERPGAEGKIQNVKNRINDSASKVESKTITTTNPEIIIVSKEPVRDVPSTPKPVIVSPEPNKASANVVPVAKPAIPPRRSKVAPPTEASTPLFTSIKLKPTKHRLYDRSDSAEQEVVSPVATQQPNKQLSPSIEPVSKPNASQVVTTEQPKAVLPETSKNVKVSLDDIPDKIGKTTPSNDASTNQHNTSNKSEENTESVTQKAAVSSSNQVAANLSSSKKTSNDVVNKMSVEKNKPPTAKSINDIPSPPKKPATSSNSNGESDLQAVLRKRKEKSAASDLPVTNIDDVLSPRRGSGSRVFDTRKSMGKDRKVPEYEKIYSGPTVDFTDGKVVVGNGCLKVPSATGMKKNLSFNDLELYAVHEYPSEKLLIQQIAKEKDAVYWDDPDHMQAAPDRSVDEPEPEATKSSLRSSLTGTPATLGSLGSHKPSHHQEVKIGQASATSTRGEDESKPDVDEDEVDGIRIKPADEQEVKSWSSDGTSDILF